jgi:biopolymer transport protein ExbD
MSASMSSDSSAEPNLTPILDMVFQLITFFMMVINIKTASIDKSLRLPIVGTAVAVESKGVEDLLVLNINKEGDLIVFDTKRDVERYIAQQAKASLNEAKKDPRFKDGGTLPTTVVIRADQQTPFEKLDNVIKECQKHGLVNFQFRGYKTAPKKQ